jgi:hypothetical protein
MKRVVVLPPLTPLAPRLRSIEAQVDNFYLLVPHHVFWIQGGQVTSIPSPTLPIPLALLRDWDLTNLEPWSG